MSKDVFFENSKCIKIKIFQIFERIISSYKLLSLKWNLIHQNRSRITPQLIVGVKAAFVIFLKNKFRIVAPLEICGERRSSYPYYWFLYTCLNRVLYFRELTNCVLICTWTDVRIFWSIRSAKKHISQKKLQWFILWFNRLFY